MGFKHILSINLFLVALMLLQSSGNAQNIFTELIYGDKSKYSKYADKI